MEYKDREEELRYKFTSLKIYCKIFDHYATELYMEEFIKYGAIIKGKYYAMESNMNSITLHKHSDDCSSNIIKHVLKLNGKMILDSMIKNISNEISFISDVINNKELSPDTELYQLAIDSINIAKKSYNEYNDIITFIEKYWKVENKED